MSALIAVLMLVAGLGLLVSLGGGAVELSRAAAATFRRRAGLRALRADLDALEPRSPRRSGAHHCPACGRFARVTSVTDRGTRTACSVHGIRLRRSIGYERPLLALVTVYQGETVTTTDGFELSAPARHADWLDGVTWTVTPAQREVPRVWVEGFAA